MTQGGGAWFLGQQGSSPTVFPCLEVEKPFIHLEVMTGHLGRVDMQSNSCLVLKSRDPLHGTSGYVIGTQDGCIGPVLGYGSCFTREHEPGFLSHH